MPAKQNILLIHSILLFVFAAFTVSQALKLSELAESMELVPKASSIEGVVEQQEALRDDLQQFTSSEWISKAQYQTDQNELRRQIEAASQPIASVELQALKEDLRSLAEEVERTAQNLAALQKIMTDRPATAVATSRRKSPRGAPRKIDPPFTIIGLEWRGGESFLAVMPVQGGRLADVALMRAGDTHSSWRLSAIEPGAAQFALPDGNHQILKFE